MKIAVRYFASIREALGAGETVDADAADVAGLRRQLVERGGLYAEALGPGRSVRSARNRVLCAESTLLVEADEIGFFPPVTGG
ncbi:MAG: MoaD/ThiS family protein [Pseudomonadota bacterium]|nr:MoaD/ThiS family protein [Pseudomonadota bacterium]